MGRSELEAAFARQLESEGIGGVVREYVFHPRRRWRLDFAWPAERVAVEIEGGVWARGRHVRGSGFEHDCVKYNEAICAGWKVLRVTGGQVMDRSALGWVRRVLGTTG